MSTTVRLSELELIARGGQSDIYAFGEGRVLRVARRELDYDRLRYEFRVYEYLGRRQAPVPRAFDLVDADGAPAISMERVSGGTLMDRIRRNPLGARSVARELARLHVSILRFGAEPPIIDSKEKARFCVSRSELLPEEIKADILALVEALPGGRDLCHGDFHPGNIIRMQDRDCIIDWSAASRGDFHSDVAHTYLLLKNVPRVPGVGRTMHTLQRRVGSAVASTYLHSLGQELRVDRGLLSRWLLVKAAERTYYGLPSEKARLVQFITDCLGNRSDLDRCHELL